MSGYWAIGSEKIDAAPKRETAMAMTQAKMGR
jgi:hypothetical protein